MMNYSIHGPFEIKKQKNGLVDMSKSAKKHFWDYVKEKYSSLPSSCGCYLFAIRAAKGIKPWYVGLAGKQSFEKECFTAHKINIYNEVIARKKGNPLLFLIAKRTKKGKLANPSKRGHQHNINLETILIGVTLEKNPELMNIKKTKFLKEMCVPCLINTPKRKPTKSEIDFKIAIG